MLIASINYVKMGSEIQITTDIAWKDEEIFYRTPKNRIEGLSLEEVFF